MTPIPKDPRLVAAVTAFANAIERLDEAIGAPNSDLFDLMRLARNVCYARCKCEWLVGPKTTTLEVYQQDTWAVEEKKLWEQFRQDFEKCFPDVRSVHDQDGNEYFCLYDVAKSMGLTETEAQMEFDNFQRQNPDAPPPIRLPASGKDSN